MFYESLETSWSIFEPEWDPEPLMKAPWSHEGSEMTSRWMNCSSMVSLTLVKECKPKVSPKIRPPRGSPAAVRPNPDGTPMRRGELPQNNRRVPTPVLSGLRGFLARRRTQPYKSCSAHGDSRGAYHGLIRSANGGYKISHIYNGPACVFPRSPAGPWPPRDRKQRCRESSTTGLFCGGTTRISP